jgi:LPXTG-motif cell wall-anchored protein
VSLYLNSTPTLLGTVTTDAQGKFATSVTIPANLAPGAHHLVSAGADPSGNMRYLRSDVTVTTPSGQLAWTGFETAPFVLAGVLAVLLGVGLVVVTRRRRTA